MRDPNVRNGNPSACRFAAICNAASLERCLLCHHLLRARYTDLPPVAALPVNAGSAYAIHPAALMPQEIHGKLGLEDDAPAERHAWSRTAAGQDAGGIRNKRFDEVCDAGLSRIRHRLRAIGAGSADAAAGHADAVARGDVSGALQWEARAKFLALEERFLKQALGSWRQKKTTGRFAPLP